MQTYTLFILLTVLTASVFAGGSGEVRAETVTNNNHTSVQTTITSRSNTGGNSVSGGDGASGTSGADGANGTDGADGEDGEDGAPGTVSEGSSRSYVDIQTVVDGEVVVDERHEANGEAGESVSIDVDSSVVDDAARTTHSITVGDRTESGSTASSVSNRSSASQSASVGSTAGVATTSEATTTESSVHDDEERSDMNPDESASGSPWTFITGLFTKFFTYVGSFFS